MEDDKPEVGVVQAEPEYTEVGTKARASKVVPQGADETVVVLDAPAEAPTAKRYAVWADGTVAEVSTPVHGVFRLGEKRYDLSEAQLVSLSETPGFEVGEDEGVDEG